MIDTKGSRKKLLAGRSPTRSNQNVFYDDGFLLGTC
jgi:hypothetical protein